MKTSIIKTSLYTLALITILLLSSFTLKRILNKNIPKANPNGFAVLELFTSQGCSSCPPADAVLGKYVQENNPNVIPLSFHVDYWNHIGWKDPFSKAEFSNRQREYAQKMNADNVYTPQIIINGKYELVGSKESEIKDKVSEELNHPTQKNVSISKASVKDGLVHIDYDITNLSQDHVVNLTLIKKKEFTAIKRGENSGLKQTGYNIVFDFSSQRLPKKGSNTFDFTFQKDWLPSDFKVVAYVQSSKTGIIFGASQKDIE